jgi:hypothetical protein
VSVTHTQPLGPHRQCSPRASRGSIPVCRGQKGNNNTNNGTSMNWLALFRVGQFFKGWEPGSDFAGGSEPHTLRKAEDLAAFGGSLKKSTQKQEPPPMSPPSSAPLVFNVTEMAASWSTPRLRERPAVTCDSQLWICQPGWETRAFMLRVHSDSFLHAKLCGPQHRMG